MLRYTVSESSKSVMCGQLVWMRFLCVMLGCGTLLPWNTVLAVLDYLGILFSNCRLDYLPVSKSC